MDYDAAINALRDNGDLFGLEAGRTYEVTTFSGYRRSGEGAPREVQVEIWDQGAGWAGRYRVRATDAHGRVASGSSAPSIWAAIALVHWWELDLEPRG